jgi:hypothetical protein
MYISNGGQSKINETNMKKINVSAKMKVSTENSAIAHTFARSFTKNILMII